MKKLMNLKNTKVLSKNEQKTIKGSCFHRGCNSYQGPKFVTCEQYHELPPRYQQCVFVSVNCENQNPN